MNRMIRGMAGLMVALGASACGEDPSIDFGGEAPTQIQATPTSMLVEQGKPEVALFRLVDDRNRSTATSFEISNVSSGLTVVLDDQYRPDYLGSEELEFNPIQHQHRYFVTGVDAVAGSFTVKSGGISQVITVKVVATTLGASLSTSTPAVGDEVTITAPANLSFTENSVVSFAPGGEAVIVDQQAKSITFIPIPGSSGAATVTEVATDYLPTLAHQTLKTENELSVDAVTDIPLVYSTTTPGAGQTVTVTAAGFEFLPTTVFTYGADEAFVVSLSADSKTATILPPPNMAGQAAEVDNVVLDFLASVTLSDLESTTGLTTTAYPAAVAGGTSLANAPTLNAASPGVGAYYAEAGTLTFGPNVNYLGGGNAGAPRYYKLIVTTAGVYDINMYWNGGGDMDLYLRTAADANVANSPSGANPEHVSATLAVGTYYIVLHDWNNFGPAPTEVLITVK